MLESSFLKKLEVPQMPSDVTSLLFDAANLMVIGMFVVFLFLATLIGAVNLIAWVNSKFPEVEVPVSRHQPSQSKSNIAISSGVVAAISAAIHQHRNNK
ncbi:MAG: OadG family transporter subunit [Paraglaciecola sp.]|uniref:OadG family protein n=1 Tax=Pseudomonadati TaxID=3379134 RepID=UPI00273D5A34|nr:OadG family transporter subunit [Paraglaciecola sp.]MDP5030185.1 OadG family transporter subunit [Paraglaciecola sp.]MDP5040294.1 OadG family transporter subunit [Paraglaciecola sp.]MDP5130765.1 OadG family transporter subunit [Paraglaciecola sp.]